jgi:hypothetical protein
LDNLRQLSERKRLAALAWPHLAVAAVFLLTAVLNVWWIARYRLGNPLDIDEAGYMSAAYDDTTALLQHGLPGLIHAYRTPSQFGPLVPLLTVPVHLVLGLGVYAGLYVELPFLLCLLLASYALGSRLGGRTAGLLTVVGVAGLPAVVDFSRSYQFVLPTTALFIGAVFALVRSEGGRNWRWSAVWGALLGAAVLARLMVLGFVPGFIAAVLVQALAGRDQRRRRILNTAIGTAVAVGVAATWYAKNLGVTLHYLLLYGYGAKAADYGPRPEPLTVGFWTRQLTASVDQFLYLPLALVMGIGLVAALVLARPRASRRLTILSSDAAAIGLVIVAGYLALTSTSNIGTGFAVPLVALVVVLAVAAIVRIPSPAARNVLMAALMGASTFNLASKADLVPGMSATASAAGRTVADGRGALQHYIAAARYPVPDSTTPLPELQHQWLPVAHDLAELVEAHSAARGVAPIVCFASRDPMFNTNTFGLVARFVDQRTIPVAQLDSRLEGDSVQAYRDALTDPLRGQPNYLVTADRAPGEFRGRVTQAYAESAARSLRFVQIATLRLPDDRETRLWWRGWPLLAP